MKVVIVAGAIVLSPAIAQAANLDLLCEGAALVTSTETSKIDTGISNGFGANRKMTMETESVRSIDRSVAIRIRDDGTGDAKLPGWGMPLWVTKSEDGWRPLTELVVADDQITGSFSLNPINNPSFEINRKTGKMTLRARGVRFSGECAKAPDKDAPNKF